MIPEEDKCKGANEWPGSLETLRASGQLLVSLLRLWFQEKISLGFYTWTPGYHVGLLT